jgi:hypothetical protein
MHQLDEVSASGYQKCSPERLDRRRGLGYTRSPIVPGLLSVGVASWSREIRAEWISDWRALGGKSRSGVLYSGVQRGWEEKMRTGRCVCVIESL